MRSNRSYALDEIGCSFEFSKLRKFFRYRLDARQDHFAFLSNFPAFSAFRVFSDRRPIIKMSLLPYLLEELSQPTVYDQHFGLDLFADDLLTPFHSRHAYPHYPAMLQLQYPRPYRLSSAAQSGLSNIQNDNKNFKVNLDVQQFKPEEVSVKVVDGYIVVDGKHEERSDEHGYISRQFTRRYKVPDNVDPNAITSSLSSDGVLSIGAPKKVIEGAKGERPIQIVQTNQPSIKAPQNKGKENGEKMDTNQ